MTTEAILWVLVILGALGALALGYLEYREEREYRSSEFKSVLVGAAWLAFWWAIFICKAVKPVAVDWWRKKE